MMKKFQYSLLGIIIALVGCENNYLEDLYIAPEASFSTEKSEYQVLETVYFTNTGKGSSFSVWPGNTGHKYGNQGDTGFAAGSDGVFAYSYDEPGTYEVVWIASSIDGNGNIVSEKATQTITVVDSNGGLEKFVIGNIYKMTEYAGTVYYSSTGEFVSPDTIMCPILWAAWRDAKVNTIKAKQLITFSLTSSTATMAWYDKSTETAHEIKSAISTSRIVNFLENDKFAIQKFIVSTSSGYVRNYYVAPVMIPAFTQFSIAGVDAKISRDVSYYDRYNVTITLPAGTDLSQVTPDFVVMSNDPNLLDGSNCEVTVNGVVQTSGQSTIDLSSGSAVYEIKYQMLGCDNKLLTQTSQMYIQVEK